MTREKQIDEFAYSQVDCEFFDERLHEGIIIGAKWADEHPKPGIVDKQEFIEKAKKWVRNFLIGNLADGVIDRIVRDFEKYMEE